MSTPSAPGEGSLNLNLNAGHVGNTIMNFLMQGLTWAAFGSCVHFGWIFADWIHAKV